MKRRKLIAFPKLKTTAGSSGHNYTWLPLPMRKSYSIVQARMIIWALSEWTLKGGQIPPSKSAESPFLQPKFLVCLCYAWWFVPGYKEGGRKTVTKQSLLALIYYFSQSLVLALLFLFFFFFKALFWGHPLNQSRFIEAALGHTQRFLHVMVTLPRKIKALTTVIITFLVITTLP